MDKNGHFLAKNDPNDPKFGLEDAFIKKGGEIGVCVTF